VEWVRALGIALGAALVLWGLLLVLLWRARPDAVGARESLRLLPDVVRLVRRLAADRSLPRGTRLRLGALLVYLLSPVDLVPDVLPVIGYADDVVVVGWVLRSVVRRAGVGALRRHWPGTPAGLDVVLRLTGASRACAGSHSAGVAHGPEDAAERAGQIAAGCHDDVVEGHPPRHEP
jgi:uncharacterized membrane protein YkvA (DUF1232 family)